MSRWAYRVERPDAPDFMSYGVRSLIEGTVIQDCLDRVAWENRLAHSYYTGPLTVHVWPAREDEHYRAGVPADALSRSYDPGQPVTRWFCGCPTYTETGDPIRCQQDPGRTHLPMPLRDAA